MVLRGPLHPLWKVWRVLTGCVHGRPIERVGHPHHRLVLGRLRRDHSAQAGPETRNARMGRLVLFVLSDQIHKQNEYHNAIRVEHPVVHGPLQRELVRKGRQGRAIQHRFQWHLREPPLSIPSPPTTRRPKFSWAAGWVLRVDAGTVCVSLVSLYNGRI
jgi:hypothetical protein